jgi:hypothetical protein
MARSGEHDGPDPRQTSSGRPSPVPVVVRPGRTTGTGPGRPPQDRPRPSRLLVGDDRRRPQICGDEGAEGRGEEWGPGRAQQRVER